MKTLLIVAVLTELSAASSLARGEPHSFAVVRSCRIRAGGSGNFGNLGRNTLITPHFQSFDFAVHKQFQMPYSEHHIVQFRLEAFNILNHPSWGAPRGNILAGAEFPGAPANAARSGFGVNSTTALPMRQLQLALKYSF